MYTLITLAVLSFVLSLLLTPLVRNLSLRFGWVDAPDARRKVHRAPIPRTGGVAVLAAYLGAYALLLAMGLRGTTLLDLGMVARVAPAVAILFVVGLVDDLMGLTAWQKLAGQFCAAGAAYSGGLHLANIGGWALPDWMMLPATLAWLILVTNAVNLIDGMDGLATGVALFATLTMLTSGLQNHNIPLAMAVVPLAGALLGFLRYNFNPATVFLGDCGSLTIGFLLGCFGISWAQKSATMLGVTAPLMALAIPLLDSGLAVVRRFLRRESIFGADRGHVHHKLLDRGLSVRQAALVLYGVSLLFAILSLASSVLHDSYAGVVLVLFGAVTWIGVQSLGYVEINMAGRLLLGGGFRRMLIGQLVLRNFDEAVRSAERGDEIWHAVRETSRELGFARVEMGWMGAWYEERLRSEHGDAEWTVEVPLAGGDFVKLTRPFDAATHQSAMGPFLDAIRKSLINKKIEINGQARADAAGA